MGTNAMTTRPKVTDQMILGAAVQVAAKVGGNAEDIANQYCHPMDGYELAKALERWCSWDIKRSDIDDLDEIEWLVRQLHEEAVKQWVVGFDIKPILAIGTRIKQGVIAGISDRFDARYMVKENGCTREGRHLLIKYEDALVVEGQQ